MARNPPSAERTSVASGQDPLSTPASAETPIPDPENAGGPSEDSTLEIREEPRDLGEGPLASGLPSPRAAASSPAPQGASSGAASFRPGPGSRGRPQAPRAEPFNFGAAVVQVGLGPANLAGGDIGLSEEVLGNAVNYD